MKVTKQLGTKQDWDGKQVTILGAARQGVALARYLLRHGARVVLNDIRPMEEMYASQSSLDDLTREESSRLVWVCGSHPFSVLDGTELICISGGVPLTLNLVVEARRRGIRLSNDSQIFLQATPCRVIGITGSAGKTTTTTLVGRIAEAGYRIMAARPKGRYSGRIWIGGNIGTPLITHLDSMKPPDLAIMELSSFQLEIMDVAPQVAAVLNVTPNHLDRHASMQDYLSAKGHILDYQQSENIAILGRDDPGAWLLADRVKGKLISFGMSELTPDQDGTFYDQGTIYLRASHQLLGEEAGKLPKDLPVLRRSEIQLRGEHNLLNVLAACAITYAAGLPIESIPAGIAGFTGVSHRLEFIRIWGSAAWYNDSIATAPERVIAAIHSFEEPLILILGGRDKNLSWTELATLVSQRVKHLIVFGEAVDKIIAAMDSAKSQESAIAIVSTTHCSGLKEAVLAAARIVEPGDVVLLSPGGTSFDEFHDFEERGECFVQLVNELP